MNQKRNKGITLIALVITIIVLLILAGVTISIVLGDDGIIAQAQGAKNANEKAAQKDAVEIAKGEAALSGYINQTPMSDSDLNTALGKTGEDVIEDNTTVAKVVDGVPIPVGFAYVEGTKKDTGLIVVDSYGNEFVWVPVDEVLTSGGSSYTDNKVSLIHNDSDASDTPQLNGIPTGVADDYEDMKESVEIYGGFYVGRYETSWTGTKVASTPNVTSMSGSTQVNGSGANWYTFYTEQKKLHANSSSVVSGMIYGSQWDAIMDWMSDVPNVTDSSKLYINDSTDMGHYCYGLCDVCGGEGYLDPEYEDPCDNCEESGIILITDEEAPIKTGSNSAYSVKNIFDLAGNYCEWTQKANFSSNRIFRGGSFDYWGSFEPASTGATTNGGPGSTLYYGSSRLQLYIK